MGAVVSPEKYQLLEAPWSECESVCTDIRRQVFIVEQAVPESEEWDGLDQEAAHFVVYELGGKHAVACARLVALPSATATSGITKVTRMAVLRSHRGRGLGRALLQAMLRKARGNGAESVVLDAQIQALGFYAKEGFMAEGKPFMDAGIEHIKMIKQL